MEQVIQAYKEAIRYKDYLTFIQFDLIQANCQLQQQENGHIQYYYPNIQQQGKCQQCPKDCSRCFDQQICFSCLNEQLVQEDTNKCFSQCPSGFKKLENYDVCTNKDFKDEKHSNIKYILFYAGAGFVLALLIALIIIMVIKIKKLKQTKLEQSQEQSNEIYKNGLGIKSKLLQSDQIGINDEFDQENQQQLIQQNQQILNQNNSNQCNTSKSQNSNRTNNSNKIIQSLNKSNNSINSSKFPENQLVIHNQFNIFSSLYNDKVESQETFCSLEQDLQNPKIFWSSQKFNSKFQFISLLGQGTYGKVYKYYDIEKKQQIAIKEIQMAGDLLQIIKKEAYNEINNLKKMQNIPNIVQLIQYYILEIDNKMLLQNEIQKIKEENADEKEIEYGIQDKNSAINIQNQSSQSSSCYFSDSDSEEQENICYKMMICLELGQNSLENFILRQKQKVKKLFSQKVVLQIMTDITKACYDLQVITNFAHRDIKPKNILFANQKWKLCDFGSAKNLGKQVKQFEKLKKTMTRKNTMIGTVNYLSPEQKTNYVLNALQKQENPINPFKSDVFSLGITFFEVLTLGNINGINDRSDLLQMKIQINLNSKNDIYDKRIIQTVIQMLSWDPDQRPSFKDIVNDLSKII
ncbi:Protein kinase-like domain [Pseudocohnilembus persalinus]|uniref:Protein kinase-like domain n=1 Tax=Pseudocohnilembus persalinus TaxID=266149 RepID=A0A0V0QCQ8_PSEPJ|nr:Protein kinase-like domain [Pseudocohnilembus persalinus]|eukprot:KRX00001.1 Protein kinase-like domain [Pseudocohnilembus persalinus]